MNMAETIRRKLETAFAPSELTVRDVSAEHEDHSGHRHGGETHFEAAIVSAAFAGVSRLERQKRVHAALHDELKRIHALSLRCRAPGE
jgi:BolA family transcriptional regulator, general stress-responsive regulator